MANLGIGLGSFMSGMANGIGLGNQIQANQYRQEQIDRQRKNQAETDAFNTAAKTEFDEKVKTGEQKPEDIANFMIQYKGPQRAAMLVQQGDYAGAKAWRDWYESDAAKQGATLFSKALFKAQAGDVNGALDTAIQAGQTKGYLDHNLSLGGKEEIKGPDGTITGYRVHLKQAGGDDLIWNVDANNITQGIAQLLNPEAAYQTRLDRQKERDKAALDVETYGAKKGIDDRFQQGTDARKHGYDIDLAREKKKLGVDTVTPPADVAAAQWLAQRTAAAQGREATDQDQLDAYAMVRKAKDSPNGRAALVVRTYEGMASDYNDERSPEEKRNAARKFVDDLFAEENGGGEKPRAGGAPAPKPEPGVTKPKAAKAAKANSNAAMGTAENPFTPTTDEEFAKLPKGAIFIDPDDNKPYRKP